jgi:hypothetical protein
MKFTKHSWYGVLFIFVCIMSCNKKDCHLKSKYIYEALVYDEQCNCIVAGKVKYLKDCTTVALVDYGDGTCDNIAIKTICPDGKCDGPALAFEAFEFDCQDANVVEGPISDEEAALMGI